MMLEYIRTNSQSMGVKIAFGIIILVFVFWGVGSLQNISPTTVVASVNGEPISIVAFEKAYMQVRNSVLQEDQPEAIKKLQLTMLPQIVLQQMTNSALLKQEAERLDMIVSDSELRSVIEQLAVFQGEDGKFDPARYKQVLAARQERLSDFEQMVRDQLLESNLRNDMTVTGEAFESEVRAFYDYTFENRDVEYVFFPAESAMEKVGVPAEDAIKSHYESNRNTYSIPAKASIDYVVVSPTAIVDPASMLAEEVEKFYEANKAQFTEPQKAKARHILIRLATDASAEDVEKAMTSIKEIEKQLQEGADFAELAKTNSEDEITAPNGGDLDWMYPGDMVKEFNDAVFAMQAGEISAPVRTDFGMHLIQVDEAVPSQVRTLAEVEQVIRNELARVQGMTKINEVLDNLIEANILGQNLADAAKAQKLELKTSELLSEVELAELLKISATDAAKILATSAGVPLDAALASTDQGYIVVRVMKKEDSSVRPLEDVRAEIATSLQEKSALEEVLREAGEKLKTIEQTGPGDSELKLISNVIRGNVIGELGSNEDLSKAIFNAEDGQWLPAAYTVSVDGKIGAVLVRNAMTYHADDEQFGAMEQIIAMNASMQRKNDMFGLFLASLLEKAEIQILNQEYLDFLSQQ